MLFVLELFDLPSYLDFVKTALHSATCFILWHKKRAKVSDFAAKNNSA